MNRFLIICILIVFPTVANAQFRQSQYDSLATDSISLVTSQAPSASAGQLNVQVDLYVFNDGNNITGTSMGFGWDNPNLQMDSAVISPTALSAFNFIQFVYDGGDINTTNANRRFLFVGARNSGSGMVADTIRRLWASYYFTLSQWTSADSIVVDTLRWSMGSKLKFFDEQQKQYIPNWQGSLLILDAPCCTGPTGNVDMDPNDIVDIVDLTLLGDHLFISFAPLPCPAEANVDGDPAGNVDISDYTLLIDHLFINYTPLANCP